MRLQLGVAFGFCIPPLIVPSLAGLLEPNDGQTTFSPTTGPTSLNESLFSLVRWRIQLMLYVWAVFVSFLTLLVGLREYLSHTFCQPSVFRASRYREVVIMTADRYSVQSVMHIYLYTIMHSIPTDTKTSTYPVLEA
ncbi:unnamed protein product [Protopolystoma xenopodis]|uniref:Uncharacterized protein n=1 Tax=Protopolystoma xenopodis TaxID=117903 RepID=A0A3S5A9L6_9PLAT|nr:unnamed protein product [Protopolystoma xenopodis]